MSRVSQERPPVPSIPAAAEPPPLMDVDAALTIRERLSEVYLDAARGYAEDWSDKAIGKTLDVPRDWVRQVRRKVYGEASAGDSEDVRDVLREARDLSARAALLLDDAQKATSPISDLLSGMKGVRASLDKMAVRLSSIEAAVK